MFPSPPPPKFRNAITHFSITPLRLKTSSVPLDGRIFKTATLDAELTTELEDATLFEEAGVKGNYIVFWYQLSCLVNLGKIKAELLITIKKMSLFCNGRWEPSLIPHVLRRSTADLTGAGNSRSSGRRTQSNPPRHSASQSNQPTATSGSKRCSRASLRWEPVTRCRADSAVECILMLDYLLYYYLPLLPTYLLP